IDAGAGRAILSAVYISRPRVMTFAGLELKKLQTGHLRQYVMFIVVGTVALFVLASLLFRTTVAG
ncbi:MAG: hypothetical protein ACK52C_14015, partial [Planctomycetia bacterium]